MSHLLVMLQILLGYNAMRTSFFFSSVNLASVTVLEITGIGINYEKLFVVCQHLILLDFVVFLIK